jgi:hypothetical protein
MDDARAYCPQGRSYLLSRSCLLGDKKSLEQEIYQATGIAVEALRGYQLGNFGVEERFKWAEKRNTTEEEDK